jgi:hypothetical protein
MSDNSNIPQKLLDFFKAVAVLAGNNDYANLHIRISPSYTDQWKDSIEMNWQGGRLASHVLVSSTVNVRTSTSTKEETK